MYWGMLIALDSVVNSCLDPKVEFFFEKRGWVIRIDDVLYRKNDLAKKSSSKNKVLKTYQYIRFRKTLYGTEVIENRATLDSPWHVAGETRGKTKVIDDLKGIVKIEENHRIKVQHLGTGKNTTFAYPVKAKVLNDNYLVLWSKKSESGRDLPLLYDLPEMNLIEIKERTPCKGSPLVVEL